MTIEFHPLADIFPLIEGAEFDALVDDVREHGLADKIVTHEDKILDGRNRYRALAHIGLTDEEILHCHSEPFVGTDALAFVISKNLKRRHLNESQRAMVAARLATTRHGENQDPSGKFAARSDVPTQAEAAGLLNVSERTVRGARKVIEHGTDELKHAVDRGEVSVSAAADVATQPVEQQRELVARGEKEIFAAASKIRAEKRERKNAKARAADAERTEAPQIPPADKAASLKPLAEVPQPLEPTILGAEADFGSVNKGIDILYSRWTVLARRAIEEAQDVRMIKNIHDKAAGLEMQSHLAKNREAARQARVIRLWAERRLGRWLIDAEKKGHRYMGRPPKGVKIGKQDPDLITLGKLGISKKESQDWQKIARLSDARFEALLAGKRGRCHLPHHRRHRVRRFRPQRDTDGSPQTQADA
jgi:hypothetical protein